MHLHFTGKSQSLYCKHIALKQSEKAKNSVYFNRIVFIFSANHEMPFNTVIDTVLLGPGNQVA